MTEQTLFSIVTVTHNCVSDILPTAQSVLEQDFTDYEYIVKDGGSTDGTLEKLSQLGVRRIISKPDEGIYDAMNQALSQCTGRYVLFLNAGDVFADKAVLGRLSSYAGTEQTGPDLIYCDYLDRQAGYVIRTPDRLTDFHLYRRWICHQACFFRLSCYHRFGNFDTSLRVAADYDFQTRVVIAHKGSYVRAPLVGIVYQGYGFSSSDRNRSLFEADAAVVRRRRFTLFQRSLFAAVYAITLPGIRKALFRHRALRWALPFYIRLVNMFGLSYSRLDEAPGEKTGPGGA